MIKQQANCTETDSGLPLATLRIQTDSLFKLSVSSLTMERCLSGLKGTPGKCVYVHSVPRVRIPLSPPKKQGSQRVHYFYCREGDEAAEGSTTSLGLPILNAHSALSQITS